MSAPETQEVTVEWLLSGEPITVSGEVLPRGEVLGFGAVDAEGGAVELSARDRRKAADAIRVEAFRRWAECLSADEEEAAWADCAYDLARDEASL